MQEWWGLVPHIEQVADRFAAEGFIALAPDLYHGQRATSPDQAGMMMMALRIDEAARDIDAAIDRLGRQPGVYDRAAAADAWGKTLAFFRRELKS